MSSAVEENVKDKKDSLLPPEALKYLLTQIQNMPDSSAEKSKMLKIAELAAKKLLKDEQEDNGVFEERVALLKSQFFLPFKRVIFKGDYYNYQKGRFSENSIDLMWKYISEDLLIDEVDEYSQMMLDASIQNASKKMTTIAQEFSRVAQVAIEEKIIEMSKNETFWRRFNMILGSQNVGEDLKELCVYLKELSSISELNRFFPPKINDLGAKALVKISEDVEQIKNRKPHLLAFYCSLFIQCLKKKEQALRVIQSVHLTDDASSAENCDLKIIGELLLFDAKVHCFNFNRELKRDRDLNRLLEEFGAFASIILGMEREFIISTLSDWGKEIIELKKTISPKLERELRNYPGFVQRILGHYQDGNDGFEITMPDQVDVDELIFKITFLYGIRDYIASTTCNAVFQEIFGKIVPLINIIADDIVAHLRRETDHNRKALLDYLDLAKNVIKIAKGREEAAIYYKSGILASKRSELQDL